MRRDVRPRAVEDRLGLAPGTCEAVRLCAGDVERLRRLRAALSTPRRRRQAQVRARLHRVAIQRLAERRDSLVDLARLQARESRGGVRGQGELGTIELAALRLSLVCKGLLRGAGVSSAQMDEPEQPVQAAGRKAQPPWRVSVDHVDASAEHPFRRIEVPTRHVHHRDLKVCKGEGGVQVAASLERLQPGLAPGGVGEAKMVGPVVGLQGDGALRRVARFDQSVGGGERVRQGRVRFTDQPVDPLGTVRGLHGEGQEVGPVPRLIARALVEPDIRVGQPDVGGR